MHNSDRLCVDTDCSAAVKVDIVVVFLLVVTHCVVMVLASTNTDGILTRPGLSREYFLSGTGLQNVDSTRTMNYSEMVDSVGSLILLFSQIRFPNFFKQSGSGFSRNKMASL